MLKLVNISKSYTIGDFNQNALDNLSVEFKSKDFVAILGPSGCGKTTLLNVIGGLDHADKGDLLINGRSTKDFKDGDWDMYRNNSIGFIFQSHNLITHLSVLQNVEMGLSLSGVSKAERTQRATEVLERVGLKDHIHKRPNQLSGGQSQRVAIARALANNPEIILADEPTGSLDSETSVQIMELIKEIAKEKLVILVTHDSELAKNYASRLIRLKDGQITSDSKPEEAGAKNGGIKFKKTAMSFKTAFISSLNNIRTKLGRTILTALAGSIGIIGIALILSLSNGLDQQISNFEQDTLSGYPISITESKLDFEKMMNYSQEDLVSYPETDSAIIFDESQLTSFLQPNTITDDYIQYVEDYVAGDGQTTLAGVKYQYYTNMSLLKYFEISDTAGAYMPIYQESTDSEDSSSSPYATAMNLFTLLPDGTVFDKNYDLIYGNLPINDLANGQVQVVLVVDEYNRIFKSTLEALGFDTTDITQVNFNDIVGTELKLYIGTYDVLTSDVNDAMTVTISGIIRQKESSNVSLLYNGLGYTSDVTSYISENYPDEVGAIKSIQLYPNDFDSKELVKAHLDAYNTDLPESAKVEYIDQAATITAMVGGVIDTISIVLIAFTAVSLVVSSIMISIITYVSVIERTKEIGVLRALGARKKDISRIFNVENIIIGFGAGFTGILVSALLLIPINLIIEHFANMANVASLNPLAAIILILISVFLAVVAGLLPARMAAKKDPVVALRTE
ncbi:MAG: ATP-binding cassette domain-containing protein [Bacilli bacterium]|nr:ATP-binding cassette domain-containing protein [Bacilli bacterium]MBN2876345.1 ATP-binding cassette domain-containing protein [Bacilli bacterium]